MPEKGEGDGTSSMEASGLSCVHPMLVDTKGGFSRRLVLEQDAMTTEPMWRGMVARPNCAVSIWNETTQLKDRMCID